MFVNHHPLRLALVVLALIGIGMCVVGGRLLQAAQPSNRSDAEVKVDAKATKIDAAGKQVITVTLDISKGWHIYANPVGNEDFEAGRTVVKIKTAKAVEEVEITYPPGKVNQDKLAVYENRVQIQAHLRRAAGDTGPLEVSVRFQACNDTSCLLPATVKRTIP